MSTQTARWVGRVLHGDRYHITAVLGTGGMAHVYRAKDRRLDCEVVVKVPQAALLQDPEFAGRFGREIRSLVRLSHPHVVKVTDVGEQDGLPFAVMQYLSGGSLRQRQRIGRDGKPVPCQLEDVRGWLGQVGEALDFIHKQGFVHRDIKPDNILFDAEGHVYLSDFGIAKALRESSAGEQTSTGMLLGTPRYMAPELILGQPYDGRADQYGLAVTLYELLSGRVPFDGPTATAIYEQQKTPPPRLDGLVPGVSGGVAAAVQRALACKPGNRYPTCAAFAAAVLNTLGVAGGSQRAAGSKSAGPTVPVGEGTVVQMGTAACPKCGKNLRLPATAQGRRGRCTSCGHEFQAPLLSQVAATELQSAVVDTGKGARAKTDTMRTPGAHVRHRRYVAIAVSVGLLGVLVPLAYRGIKGLPSEGDAQPEDIGRPAAGTDAGGVETTKTDKTDLARPGLAIAPFSADEARGKQQAWASHQRLQVEIENSVAMNLMLIPPGEFDMFAGMDDDPPTRRVRVTHPFYMSDCEVTVTAYRMYCDDKRKDKTSRYNYQKSDHDSDRTPAIVEWQDAIEFCNWLSTKERQSYRLPTEAEWEYAARSGSSNQWYFGDSKLSLLQHGWYRDNSAGELHKVGQKQANPFGLYDVYGNAAEWCFDRYEKQPPCAGLITDDPSGPDNGSGRVFRGGSFSDDRLSLTKRRSSEHSLDEANAMMSASLRLLGAVARNDAKSAEGIAATLDTYKRRYGFRIVRVIR